MRVPLLLCFVFWLVSFTDTSVSQRLKGGKEGKGGKGGKGGKEGKRLKGENLEEPSNLSVKALLRSGGARSGGERSMFYDDPEFALLCTYPCCCYMIGREKNDVEGLIGSDSGMCYDITIIYVY